MILAYPAKLKDTFGHLILHTSRHNASPTISFVSLHTDSLKFKAPICSLVELHKEGVWIGRAALSWAAATKIEGTGLVLRFKQGEVIAFGEKPESNIIAGAGAEGGEEGGEEGKWRFTDVGRRDQLFNRLIAMGDQKWETL